MFFSLRYDDTGSRYSRSFTRDNIQFESSNGIGFITNDFTKSMTIDNLGKVGVFTDVPKNSLDVNGAMAIGYDKTAPTNGLISEKNVGVGMSSTDLPLYGLEVSGSVIVGEPISTPINTGFYIKGDGSYKMAIGDQPKGNERLFVSRNISIKDGRLLIRQGVDPGMELVRDNTSTNLDQWTQLESSKGLKIIGRKDIVFKTYNTSTSSWIEEMVLDEDGKLGIGTVPDEVLHVKDEDNDVLMKIRSSENQALINLKKGSHQITFGTDDIGFHFKTDASTLTNPDLTVAYNTVGVNNRQPDIAFKLDVNGTTNANNYMIEDKFETTGYKIFQTVPTGIVIIWLGQTIPEGWEECNGSNGCPNMAGKFIKGINNQYNNQIDTGGSHAGVLSASHHSHDTATHQHKLTSPGHSHGVSIHNRHISFTLDYGDAFTHHAQTGDENHVDLAMGTGRHRHDFSDSHNHPSITFTQGGHGSNHKNSPNETHNHGGENSDNSDTKTIGTGNNSLGDNGDEHRHTFDNRPMSKLVRFIVKVNET